MKPTNLRNTYITSQAIGQALKKAADQLGPGTDSQRVELETLVAEVIRQLQVPPEAIRARVATFILKRQHLYGIWLTSSIERRDHQATSGIRG